MTFRATLKEKEKYAGGCTSYSGQQVFCDQGPVLRIPCCGPTHSQHGRLTEGLGKIGVEDELPQVCFSQNTLPLQAGSSLLKDC